MGNLTVHFSSAKIHWATPSQVYADLDREFCFDFDPCPLNGSGGLCEDWTGRRVYCNPPYGTQIDAWLAKGPQAELAVYLLPARTDTKWFHDQVLPKAKEVRFLRGRLKFGGAINNAPFPSMLVIFKREPN